MWGVKAAEDSVPISVVALRGEHVHPCFGDNGRRLLRGLRVLAPRFKPPAGLEHQFVNLVRLGILGQAVLPDAAAKKTALSSYVCRTLGIFNGELQVARGRRG